MEYKFKVGDVVQVVEGNNTEYIFDVTCEDVYGVIKQVNDGEEFDKCDRYYVEVNGHTGIYENGWFAFDDVHLEFVAKQVEAIVDNVNSPTHYASKSIECIVAMEAMLSKEEFIGYLRGNIFKYQWRYKQKNGIEDLKKAQWYQNKLIEKEGNK